MSILKKNYRLRRLALQQRSGTYYVRVVITESLRLLIRKTELKESLRTNDLKSAQQLVPQVEEKFMAIIQAAREGKPLGLEKQKVDNLNLMTCSFYRRLLKKFDESSLPSYFDAGDIREEFVVPSTTLPAICSNSSNRIMLLMVKVLNRSLSLKLALQPIV